VSSLDDESTSSDDAITSAVPVFRQPQLLRQRSRSEQAPSRALSQKDAAPKVEDILKNNIKLWKAKHTVEEESDNVFDSDSASDDRS